jgi:hypothetical protein
VEEGENVPTAAVRLIDQGLIGLGWASVPADAGKIRVLCRMKSTRSITSHNAIFPSGIEGPCGDDSNRGI